MFRQRAAATKAVLRTMARKARKCEWSCDFPETMGGERIKAGNGDGVLIKPVGRQPGSPLKRPAPGFFETEFSISGFVKSFLKSGLRSRRRRVINRWEVRHESRFDGSG